MRARSSLGPVVAVVAATLAVAALACTPSAARPAPAAPMADPDVAAIEAVLAEFGRAIVAHDGDAIAALLLTPDAPFRWRRVDTGATGGFPGSSFASDVAGGSGWEERFADVAITPRDGLAILDSRYAFLEQGVQTNHGREIWTLVQTAAGWRIASVTWSIVVDPAPADPASGAR